MSAYGWDPSNDDRRGRAIQARSQNMPIEEVLNHIGCSDEAQGELENFLQMIRTDPSVENCLSLSIFLDDQADECATEQLKRAA